MKKIALLLTIGLVLGTLTGCTNRVLTDNIGEQKTEETVEETVDVTLDVESGEYLYLVKTDKKLSLKTPKGDPVEIIDGNIDYNKTGEYEVRIKYTDSSGTSRSEEKTVFVGTDAEIQEQKKKLEEDASETNDSNTGNTGSTKPVTNTGNTKPATNTGNTDNTGNTGGNDKPKEQNCHYETRTETIPAWTEQVLVKETWTEKILVKDAWTEESNFCTAYGQDKRYIYVCHNCGHVSSDGNEANEHGVQTGHGSWYQDVEYYGDVHCLAYETEYINHPAEYSYVNHPAEYKDVYHPEETKTYQVQVCD